MMSFIFPKIDISTKGADPDEMPHFVAFDLGFTGCQGTWVKVFRIIPEFRIFYRKSASKC